MIFRMALRPASLLLLLFACATACTAQKCKGMEIKHDNPIQYPNAARAARVQGDVVLQIHIAPDGTVTADITSGPSVLAESAKRFVENWTVSWPEKDPPTACAPVLHVTYKLKEDTFNVKEKLPTHILVEAPPIETNEPVPQTLEHSILQPEIEHGANIPTSIPAMTLSSPGCKS